MSNLLISLLYILFPLFAVTFYLSGIDQKIIAVLSKENGIEKYIMLVNKEKKQSRSLKSEVEFPSTSVLKIADSLKRLWLFFEALFYPINQRLLHLFNVSFFLHFSKNQITETIGSWKGLLSDNPYKEFGKYIKNAKEIQFCVGEMGREIMENPYIIKGLKEACKKNAKIQIIGGPRVDPKVKTIFTLAEQGKIEIRLLKEYEPNHFVIITDLKDKKLIINEGIHNEILWDKKSEEPILEHYSKLLYIFKDKKRYEKAFIKELALRLKKSDKTISTNPGLNKRQKISSLKLISNSLFLGFLIKHFVQPFSIIFDLPFHFLFDPK